MAKKRKRGRKRGRRREPFKLKLSKDTLYSIASILLFAAAGVVILSFTRKTTPLKLLYQQLNYYLGGVTLMLPFLLLTAGLMLTRLKWRITRPNVFVGGVLIFLSLSGLIKAGIVGREIWASLAVLITGLGATIVFLGTAAVGFILLTEIPLDELMMRAVLVLGKGRSFLSSVWKGMRVALRGPEAARMKRLEQPAMKMKGVDLAPDQPSPASAEEKPPAGSPGGRLAGLPESQILANVPGAATAVWEYPPLSLLSDLIGDKANRGDVKKNADIIEQTLDSFGIKARVAEVNGGPAVTQYALEIALGTKLTRITALQNDLALALAAPTGQIRIEAPIPGRSLVGIEVPNQSPEFVGIKSMLMNKALKSHPSKLAVGLGLNVSGEQVIADIDVMPHVLIAGATGSGKSVAINSFLCTVLFRASPEEVKLILIDPKRVELTGYNGIPHLLTPVIVESTQVVSALKWAIKEMEQRYQRLAEIGVRNIAAYNEQSGFQAMPYILIVVDELADIMLYAPSDVEEAVTRLAQMARATGIHLVVSTQRPSTDVITGLIKANIPCRIAFNVTSMVDSRVIIDTPGAEKLLGQGDMLYVPPDQAKPTRIQGTYVSDQEIDALIAYLRQQGVSPQYNEAVTEKYQPRKKGYGGAVDDRGKEVDEFFEEAVRIVTRHDRASASLLQRRLSVGYARAARILDQLHHHGVVGPPEGSKPREVLIKNAEDYLVRLKSVVDNE